MQCTDGTRNSRAARSCRLRAVKLAASAAAITGALAMASPTFTQAQAGETPLLLIGGTLVSRKFTGFRDVPGWDHTVNFLQNVAGYRKDTDLFIGELCRDTSDTGYDTGASGVSYKGFEFTRGFLKCRLAYPTAPLDDRYESFPVVPPGWVNPPGWTWEQVVDQIHTAGGSTAGLASMQASVAYVMEQIKYVLHVTKRARVDVAAHSQGGAVARAAVRQLKQEPSSGASRVRRLITLGAPHYGASPGTIVLNLAAGTILGPVAGLFTEAFIGQCRDQRTIPFCPDHFLTEPSEDGRVFDDRPSFVGDLPYYWGTNDLDLIDRTKKPRKFTYKSSGGFFPTLNSTSSGVGPIVADTEYYNLYSRDHDGGGTTGSEQFIVEQIMLYPERSNVTNWNFQDTYRCHAQKPPSYSYPLHHIHEWDDGFAQQLILAALGYQNDVRAGCLPLGPQPPR